MSYGVTYNDDDLIMNEVFDYAMESATRTKILNTKTRDSLPDDAFGIVARTDEGERIRKYPLVVKGDPSATEELVQKALDYFHYCRPDWKPQLARKLVQVINEEKKIHVSISAKHAIFKYVDRSELPARRMDIVKLPTTSRKKPDTTSAVIEDAPPTRKKR